jgi:signal transduction histidine kinase
MNWLRQHTVENKFNIIIAAILLVLAFGVVNFWFGLKVMSSIRAYVGGEGLWSKAQKDATLSLVQYGESGNEADYQRFQNFLKVNEGDKQARLELAKPAPNYEIARRGFIQGGNNPADVDNLIFLYRDFHWVSYVNTAIRDWTQGDADIAALINVGQTMHRVVANPIDSSDPDQVSSRDAKLAGLTQQAHAADFRLTMVEDDFSAVLGAGSRYIQNVLLMVTVLLTVILGASAIWIARSVAKIIIQVDQAKTEFLALASHQLRTPATAVQAYATFLKEDYEGAALSPRQQEFVHEIYRNNHRLLEITDQMLVTIQADSMHDQIDMMPTDLVVLAKEVVQNLQSVLDGRRQTLKLRAPRRLIADADAEKMHVIIDNLLSNASKYSSAGGIITLALKSSGSDMVIEVKDSGVGIPKAEQPNIFGKFIRASPTLDTQGTGLGLYLVKRMAELHGGSVSVTSTPGKGSRFSVKIPKEHKRTTVPGANYGQSLSG